MVKPYLLCLVNEKDFFTAGKIYRASKYDVYYKRIEVEKDDSGQVNIWQKANFIAFPTKKTSGNSK